MAEKETKKTTAKKNTAKKSTEIVDTATQFATPEVGLVEQGPQEIENPSTDAIMQATDDAELVFEEKKEIEPKDSVVEAEECEVPPLTDDHDAEACTPEVNQEIETPEPLFKSDKKMVNDITNILNGIDGVKASKLGADAEVEEEVVETKKENKSPKNMTNTEEKNFYSEQFSRSWGGVMYDY